MGWRRIFIGTTLFDTVNICMGETRGEERRVRLEVGAMMSENQSPVEAVEARKFPSRLHLDNNPELSNTNHEQKTQYDRIP
jgi:hypothetical protein